jgi:hypothetical protein
MEPEVSSPLSQERDSYPYPEPDQSSPRRTTLLFKDSFKYYYPKQAQVSLVVPFPLDFPIKGL